MLHSPFVPYQSPGGRILGSFYLIYAVYVFMNTLTQLAELPHAVRQAQDQKNVRY